jgi:hypothetical protein
MKCSVFENMMIFRKLIKAILLASLLLVVSLTGSQFGIAQDDTIQPPYIIKQDLGEYGQFPHFELSLSDPNSTSQMFDLTGWDAGESFSKTSIKKIRESIDAAYMAKFNVVYLRVDWNAIEPVENQLIRGDLNKIGDLLDEIAQRNRTSEDGHQVRVIIALELDQPPAWFKQKHPASVMIHINPFHESSGPMGSVKNANDYSTDFDYGILNDPDYQKAAKKVINDIVYHFRNHPALFGWALTSPSSPIFYPGAGKDGIGGIADYSMHTTSEFYNQYAIEEDYKPLARESQAEPDLRPNWLAWSKFRRDMHRAAIDDLGMQIYSIDLNHPIFTLFWGCMAYEGDNGYRSQVWGDDYYYQLTQPYVNGVLIPFFLSSKTFSYPSGEDDTDSLHQLRASVEIAQRHGKVPVIMAEKSWRNPPSASDINDLAYLAVALGVDIIWSHNSMSENSPRWSAYERATIERTAHLNEFPLPAKRQLAEIGVLDYPFELSKFYSEKDKELEQSLTLLDALQDAGFHYLTVTQEEISPSEGTPESIAYAKSRPPWISDIKFIAPLAGSMTEYIPQRVSQFFEKVKQDGKEPFILQRRLLDSFIFNKYDDDIVRREIRTQLEMKGVKWHWLNGNKCFIVVNWPYIFIKIMQRNPSANDMRIILDQYDDSGSLFSGSGTRIFYDVLNDKDFMNPLQYSYLSGELDFTIPQTRATSFLLVWNQKMDQEKDKIISHRLEIDQKHRIATMKRSLPIAMILTIVVITLGVIFTVQLYHPTVAKKRKKRKKALPVLHDHKDYFSDS